MPLGPALAGDVLAAYNRTRGFLPRAHSVHARENRTRLASITGGGSDVRLNVASAVVEAGPRAWTLLGPALEGNREAVREIGRLAEEGLRRARARSRPGSRSRNGARMAGSNGHPLPDTLCQGSPQERRILDAILRWARTTRECGDLFPRELQVRVSRRMTRTFGTHRTRGGVHRITIARRLFKPGIEDILVDTVLHELAHLLDALTNGSGRSSHGPEWKTWCRRLGARPRRLASREDVRRVEAVQGVEGVARMPAPLAAWLAEADQR